MPNRTLLFAAAFTAVLATSAQAGPPWISVEYPANPHHASTRGASMLVRAYHHSDGINVPMRAIAEGIVDGKRVSMKVELDATAFAGVYALRSALPKGGTWVLAFTLQEGKESSATALVSVDARGRIMNVDVPSERTKDGWTVPRSVGKTDIEAALRAAQIASAASTTTRATAAIFLPLLLIGGGVVVARRKQ